mgnify:CR=1 FL=1
MKRLLFAAALLFTAIYTQAQSEKSMNTLAEEYANSSEGRLCFIEPETAVITRDDTGFSIEDLYVVGYGLDAAQYYRNLPYIGYVQLDE